MLSLLLVVGWFPGLGCWSFKGVVYFIIWAWIPPGFEPDVPFLLALSLDYFPAPACDILCARGHPWRGPRMQRTPCVPATRLLDCTRPTLPTRPTLSAAARQHFCHAAAPKLGGAGCGRNVLCWAALYHSPHCVDAVCSGAAGLQYGRCRGPWTQGVHPTANAMGVCHAWADSHDCHDRLAAVYSVTQLTWWFRCMKLHMQWSAVKTACVSQPQRGHPRCPSPRHAQHLKAQHTINSISRPQLVAQRMQYPHRPSALPSPQEVC